MQCTANLANDFWDLRKGADRPELLGTDRAFAKGFITLRAMKIGIALFAASAAVTGLAVLLIAHKWLPWGGWELVAVGAACLFIAFAYTAGPWALAYNGLGDLAVILFFGLIPAGFTYFIQTGVWTWEAIVAALACGLVIDTLLMFNNYRDRKEDALCGKRTSVVYLGDGFGRWGYFVLGTGAVALCVALALGGLPWAGILPLVYLFFFLRTWRKIVRTEHGDQLNACLGETARNMLLFGILLTNGILLG